VKHWKTVVIGMCRVEESQHWEVLEGCRKECMQELFERLKVGNSSEGIGPSKQSKKGKGQVH
jgi:hypothetical protein